MPDSPTSDNAPLPTLPLDMPRLQTILSPSCQAWTIENVAHTGSTNADLLDRFAQSTLRTQLQALTIAQTWSQTCQQFPPLARVAAEQSAGRGRQGRVWRATPGDSLLFSVGVVIPRAVAGLTGLSLAVGLAVVEGLRRLPLDAPARLALKWPNDILLDESKLGGILIETAATSAHASAVVIGIGLNLRAVPPTPSVAPTPGIGAPLPPIALAQALTADSATLLTEAFAAVLAALTTMLERFSSEGFTPFREPWWQMHRFASRAVSIIDGGQEKLSGIAVGLNEWGQLLIDTTGNGSPPTAISAGDVSLRLSARPAASGESS